MKEKFLDKVKKLQQENLGKIVLVRNGIFFCGYGKDAVIVNKTMNYKPICADEGIIRKNKKIFEGQFKTRIK